MHYDYCLHCQAQPACSTQNQHLMFRDWSGFPCFHWHFEQLYRWFPISNNIVVRILTLIDDCDLPTWLQKLRRSGRPRHSQFWLVKMFKLFVLLALFAAATAQVRHQWRPVDIGRPGSPDGRCNNPDGLLVQTLPGDSCTNFRKCLRGISCEFKHELNEFWILIAVFQIRSNAQAVFTLTPTEDSATDPKMPTALFAAGSLRKKRRNKPKRLMQTTLVIVMKPWRYIFV